jgi:hypothetical protein
MQASTTGTAVHQDTIPPNCLQVQGRAGTAVRGPLAPEQQKSISDVLR